MKRKIPLLITFFVFTFITISSFSVIETKINISKNSPVNNDGRIYGSVVYQE